MRGRKFYSMVRGVKAVHRAWMNGRIFNVGGVKYRIIEGSEVYIDGVLRNVVRFTDGQKKYEYTEQDFFEKVKVIDLI